MCAGNIDSGDVFEEIKALGACQLFEGSFFTVPATVGQKDIAPLKANYIELLNIVNEDNYDSTYGTNTNSWGGEKGLIPMSSVGVIDTSSSRLKFP